MGGDEKGGDKRHHMPYLAITGNNVSTIINLHFYTCTSSLLFPLGLPSYTILSLGTGGEKTGCSSGVITRGKVGGRRQATHLFVFSLTRLNLGARVRPISKCDPRHRGTLDWSAVMT